MRIRIKARYVVALVLIIVAVLATPWVDGFFFKQNYYKMIAVRNANGAPLVIAEYHLGWLNSTAKLIVGSGNDPKTKITVDQTIVHGPFITDPNTSGHKFAEATILSHIHLDKKIENYLLGGSNTDNGVMSIFTWVSFLQHYQNHFQSASFLIKVPEPNETKITWSGINGDIETAFKHNFELETFKTALVGGPLYIQSSDHNVQFSAQQINGEGNCEKNLCFGNSGLSIPLINIGTASQNVRITGFNYAVNTDIDDKNNFSGKLSVTLTKYDTQDYNVGPLSFQLAINNINTDALKKVITAVHDASDSMQKQSDPHASQLMLLAQLTTEAPHLVTPTFSITEHGVTNTSYGSFESTSTVSWPAKTPLPASVNDFMQANFKIHVSAATALVDQIIMSLDQRVEENQSASTLPTPIATTASATGKPQSFEEMITPMSAQGLTADEIKNIVALQQKNIPADAFNSYIDGRVSIRMIPASLAAELKRDYLTVLNTPFLNVAANAGANKQLDVWVRENKITSETRGALILLQKQGLSSEIYNASIDDIVSAKRLPTDLGEQLKTQYASTNPESSFGGGDDTVPAAAPAAAAQEQGENRKKFDAEVQQGFIIQNKDRYVIDIDYQHGELKVNGKAVPIPNPF